MNHGVRYRQHLKRCGYRGWRKANQRRGTLISKKIFLGLSSVDEERELADLNKLADLFIAWKCRDQRRATIRRMSASMKRAGFTWDRAARKWIEPKAQITGAANR